MPAPFIYIIRKIIQLLQGQLLQISKFILNLTINSKKKKNQVYNCKIFPIPIKYMK